MSIFHNRIIGATAAADNDDDDDDDNDDVYLLPVSWWERLCKFYMMTNSHWRSFSTAGCIRCQSRSYVTDLLV